MALIPFDGELDAPVVAASGLTPFSGKLDGEGSGIVDKIKGGISRAKDYGLAVVAGAGEGVASTEAGVGTFIQAPAANTLAGLTGAAALADRGITAATNYFSPGSSAVNEDLQRTAQQVSQFAGEERAKNSDSEIVARLGLSMQGDGRERVKDIQAFNREYNPELVRQQQAQAATEGFLGALGGIVDNPMAFTHTMARSAPDMAVGAGVAKGVASGVAAAGGSAARQIAGASTAGIVSEATSSANQTREGVYQQVSGMPLDKLAASDRFNTLLSQTGDATKAREILANELADQAPVLAGSGTAAGSILTNKLFGGDATAKMIAGTEKTTGKAALKNAGQESFEEVAQGVPEDMAQHGAVVQADPAAKFDLGKTIAENAAAGLAMGGGGSFASYVKDNFGKGADQAPPATPQLPDTGPMSRSANVALASGAAAASDVLGVPAEQAAAQANQDIAPKSPSALDRVFAIDQEMQSATPEQQAVLNSEREMITAAWPKVVAGTQTSFSTESGSRISATYALMDIADLTTSHDEKLKPSAAYPKDMQPRERDRAASELQISGIAQRLDPARLGESADAATGAPIVGADGLVESGNARAIALKRVYQGNPAKTEEYKQFLRDNAARFGLTLEAIDAMPSPVLVRVRETPVDRAEFARQANASTVAQMSSSEQARSDAARLDNMDDLNPDEGGDFIASRDFIRRFVSRLPGTEQAGMIDASGQLSQGGYARIRNAVLAKAYGDSPVLARMVESLDDNMRNVGKALMQAAPAIAKLRQDVNAGALFDADISPDLMAAVEELSRIKESGRSVSDALAQAGMFEDGISPEAQDLLRFLDQNIRKPRKIAEFIQRYTEALRAAGNPNQGSLLGEAQAPSKRSLINTAWEKATNAKAESIGKLEGKQSTGAEDGQERGIATGNSNGAQGNAANEEVASEEWRMFGPETGTLGIPRAQMPQVSIKLRPAMLDFLETKGISHVREDVAADELKPTQAEYSTIKADRAGSLAEDRSDASAVLLSSDGYVLDGHHRWIAKAQQHQPINVIRFNAPIDRLMDTVREFSGATVSTGSPELLTKRTQAVERFYDAANDLAQIVSQRSRAAIVPENLPGLMPTLVKLFDSAFDVVGTDIKRSTAWVKERLKAMPEFRAMWNKILPETYRKAAMQAVEQYDPNKPLSGGQMGLFDAPKKPVAPAQGDMFMGQNPAPKVAMIDGRPYDMKRDNFNPPLPPEVLTPDQLRLADEYIAKYYKPSETSPISDADRAKAEEKLRPLLQMATDSKVEYDQKIIDIASRVGAKGQMIAPLKGIKRAAEKTVLEYGGDVSSVKDLLRSTIVVDSYANVQAVSDEIKKEFDVVSIKNKLSDDARERNGGYADYTIFVRMKNGALAEIQINTPPMLSIKEHQGHKLYEAARQLHETNKDRPEIYKAMREFYDAAFAAGSKDDGGDSRKQIPPLGAPVFPLANPVANNSDSSSENLNQVPSGNITNSSPPKVGTNKQPAGNLSGNFISTTSNSSIAEGANTSYTEGNGNANGVANEQHGKRSPASNEGQGAGSAEATSVQRQADGVRAGSGRGNQRSDRNPDSGTISEGTGESQDAAGKGGRNADGRNNGKRNRAGGNAGVPAGRDIPAKTGRNYRFGDGDLTYAGGWQAKARQNIEAVELLKKLQEENRQATREEQAVLAKFIGWGSSEMANSIFGDKLSKQIEALGQYESAIATMDRLKRDYLTRSDQGFYQAFMVMQAKSEGLNYYQIPQITREQLDKAKPDTGARKWGELRDRLKATLSKEEWEAASRSTQYAHYTSKPVVNAMMGALSKMGFKGGTILEPGSGIGVFPGLMPVEMAVNSVYTGIEFDPITGGILKQLFPDERILVESFVDSKLPENFYDVAFGNPPFGKFKILGDPKYAKLALVLHDYFFAKTIDSVKPGGLVMFVTSRYTMDKKDDKARAYMAERADLVGAIRLPQTAFQKNAGTEVVTDVLFLRKKVPGQTFDKAQPWAGLGEVKTEKDTALVNEYFAAHPEMVIGTHSRKGSMYGKDEYTVLPTGGDIEAQFAKAASTLPENIFVEGRGSAAEAAKIRDMDFNPKAKKEGSFYVTDAGILMQREGGVGVRAEEKNQKNAPLLKDFVALRDAVKESQFAQLTDGDWQKALKSLQAAYADFTKKNGQLWQNTAYLQKVKVDEVDEDGVPTGSKVEDEEQRRRFPLLAKIKDDPEWTLVTALEDFNDDTGEIRPSDWLTKRTLGAPAVADVQTPADALLASLDESGTVDIEAIADRIGLSEQEAIDALGTLIYEDPVQGWVMGDEYLSGNVKKKLAAAEEAAKNDKRYQRNVDALKSVQPASKAAEDITPQIGMNWIPGQVYEQFLKELTGVTAKIEYVERTHEWALTSVDGYGTLKATNDWGAGDKAHAGWLMEKVLTGSRISLNKSVSDGKGGTKPAFDPDRTEAANQKAAQLRDEFRAWVWKDAARADKLVQLYNDKFNTTVQRKFDGRHLTLPGTSKLFNIFDHVKRGAWRVIQTGNTYLAHAVGSGKTFEMVISAMEQKRLGKIKKPMIIVPGHMLQQFASEWQQLYPTARLMVADEKDFHTDNRRKFVSRVAMSDLDGVIMTHSSFGLLDLDADFKQKMIEQELEFLRASYEEAGGDLDDIGNKKVRKDPKIKRIESQIERLEQQLEKAMSSEGKDKNVRFDEMGVDFLYVDEAHLFRKLSYATNRQMKGIDPNGSQMAWDLYMKTRWLAQKNPSRYLVMASGTPITNTTAELYTVQRFMAPQVLEEMGLQAFDDWAAQFGEEGTAIEATSSGKYEPVTRFSKFVNVGELTQMFRDFADVLNEDHLAALLGDKRPSVAGGTRKAVVTPKTDSYVRFQKEDIEPRIQASKNWKPSFQQQYNPDPIININTDARLASIDMRFMEPSLPNDPDSKLNHVIDGVIRIYRETAENRYNDKQGKQEEAKGATQMVFFESGFGRQVALNRGFNARAWFEKRLRDAGIPTSQIAFMEDYKKSSAKLKLFKDVNAGKVRVLVGSSAAMGTGVNAQQRLIALHHLDAPMVPAILEQREGRIVRQGNKNPLVQIYAYSMRGSFDENQWGMLARKKFFIEQALSGDPNIRSIEDVGEVSQLEMAAALVAENPFVLQLAGVKAEVEKLSRLQRNHEDQRARMADEYKWAGRTIDMNTKLLPEAEKEAAKVKDLSGDNFTGKADGKDFVVRKEWGAALMAQFKDMSDRLTEGKHKVGELSGFDLTYIGGMNQGSYRATVFLDLPEPVALASDASTDPVGLALRAVNAMVGLTRRPAEMKRIIQEAQDKRAALEARLYSPFPLAEMMADKIREAGELEKQMLAYGGQKTGLEREQELEDAWQAKTGAITPMFSRGNGAAGMDLRDLQAVVDRISKSFKNLPKVHVLASPSGLSKKDPVQKSLRNFIRKAGAWEDAEGATHDGEIYLFASGLADEDRAEHVLATHEVTHYGLRGAIGKDLDGALQEVWILNAKVRKAAAALKERYGLKSNIEATEEVLADMRPQDLVKLMGWRRVVKSIRDWLGRSGFNKLAAQFDSWLKSGLDDVQKADLMVADLVNAARDWVKNGKGRPFMDGTRLADGSLAEDVAAQEKWLTREAKGRGYKSIDDMAEKNYKAFENLAKLWRENHPVEGALLSRNSNSQTSTIQRADEIIQTSAATWRPLDAIVRTITHTVRLDRLTNAAYDKAAHLIDRYTPESVKAGVVADYGIPEAVLDQRTAMQGRMRVQLRKSGELIDKLATLTRAESRVAYEWMNNADPQARAYFEAQLPAESVTVMEEVKAMIDALSQEAVALGQLDPEAFKRNRFEYLRRSYAKHTAELSKGETTSRKRAIAILGDQYKGRGMTDAVDMAKFKNVAPEWWGRKLQEGKADKGLKGEKFIRLERRANLGDGVDVLAGMEATGQRGKLLEVVYWPADEAMPAKFSTWDQSGTWEVRDTKGGKLIVWRDFTKVERVAMGEIDEARYAIAKSLHGMIHDVETGRYLEWIAQTYAKKPGEAIDGEIIEASERMRDVFKPGEWVQVPETKISGTSVTKYGLLAGRYLPGPIWNDVRQTVGFRFKPLGDTYAAILSAWKTSKTALSPAVHTNNVMANMVMADWHDVTAGHILKSLRIILGASQRDGKGMIGRTGNAASRAGIADAEAAREIINRFQDSGANLGSWVTSELQKDQLEPLLAALEKEIGTIGETMTGQVGVMVAVQKALQLRFPSAWEAFKPTKAGQALTTEAGNLIGLYEAEDQVFRLAAWLRAKEEGASDATAGKMARRSFLDYHINAPWIQALRNTALPFVSFTYRAVPMTLETAARKPHKLMKLAMVAAAINSLGYLLSGGDEDDERALLPEEKAGRIWGVVPKLIRMPWNDQNGSPIFLDIRRFVPVGDVFDTGATHAALPLLPFAVPGGPLALLSELMANKSQFTGKAITLETDTAMEKASKVADHLYKAFAPNIILLPGTHAWSGVSEAAKGRTDSFGREQSTAQAVSSAFGFKAGSYPKDVLQLNETRAAQAKMMEIDRNITQLKRERQKNGIDDHDFQEKLDSQIVKKRGIMDEFQKKMTGGK